MFNPFGKLTREILDALIASNKKFFVRQTFPRGLNPLSDTNKNAFLFSHYDLEAEALVHFDALKNDKHRFLYSTEDKDHMQKLIIASTHPGLYSIYVALATTGWQTRAQTILKPKIKRYIDNTLRWKPSRTDGVNFKLYIHFGELYAELKLRNQTIKVRLEDIEKL